MMEGQHVSHTQHSVVALHTHLLVKNIEIATDTLMSMFYINKQGGTSFVTLYHFATVLWEWVIKNNASVLAIHVAGVDNKSDFLSHAPIVPHEW